MSMCSVRKMIVCSAGGGEEEWRVVMSYGREGWLASDHRREGRLAFCCLGGESDDAGGWRSSATDDWYASAHADMAYSIKQNRLFCIRESGDLERWNLDTREIDGSNAADRERIVAAYDAAAKVVQYVVVAEHSNEVFVVARNINRTSADGVDINQPHKTTVCFDVFKINDDGAGNLRLRPSSLDGLVVFVGMNHSFALPAAEFPELQTDSIYFTDDMEDIMELLWDLGIYDYRNKSFSSCYYPNDARAVTRISPSPPFWFTPTCH